ncbi:MAG: tetratricopeptide repeat protein, partial [Nitrospirae bacterium]|nr:tetratricopeptide repeat protein [Nitrospirota bacterium]
MPDLIFRSNLNFSMRDYRNCAVSNSKANRTKGFLFFLIFSLLYPVVLFAAPVQEEAEAHFTEGMQFNKERRFSEALKALTRAVELNLESHKYHQALFLTYTQTRMGLQAIGVYKELEKQHPDSPAVHYWFGRLYLESGRLPDAVSEFKESTRLLPKDDHAFISLGHTYYRMKKYSEALKAYQDANQITPRLAVVHSGIGNVYYAKNDFPHAKKAYAEALKIDPSSEEARYNLSLIYEKEGAIDLAIKEWKYLLDADPNESKIREKLAWAYYEREAYRDAAREFSLLAQINQNSPDVYFMLGQAEVLLAAQSTSQDERDRLKKGA